MKVIGYVRVSSAEQVKDGECIGRQIEQIQSYCVLKSWPEPKIIEDLGISGFKGNRPGYQSLVSLCKSKSVDIVIVYDLSRLSRNTRRTLEFIEDHIDRMGIKFVSLRNDIDTSTPLGKAFLTFSAMFAQLYRDELSYKTKLALQHRKVKGLKTGGRIPYGYDKLDNLQLVANDQEQSIIQRMLDMRSSGLSLRQIAEKLNLESIPTKMGKNWNSKQIWRLINGQDSNGKCGS